MAPNTETYPNTFKLTDDSDAGLSPLDEKNYKALLDFFRRVPEEDLDYLKDDVTDPDVIREWTSKIDVERTIPFKAVLGGKIVADATLHRSRAFARRHIWDIRILADPEHRHGGLDGRLVRELSDIVADIGLYKVTIDLVPQREESAIHLVELMGFAHAATLKGEIRDYYGEYRDQVDLRDIPVGPRDVVEALIQSRLC
jgi:ribosomal protein S18 acetylase RimI-like enzyme